jgi:peptidoglycan/LPS O-acetylase OafA/YrhL
LLAVGGFFVLSGFLITRSYETVSSPGRFLWHRFLRIFPAFWICLLITGFGFAPLAFFYAHGSLVRFLVENPAPWSYVTANSLLAMHQWRIGSLLSTVPYPFVFNSSLWTLEYEFTCYLCVAALGIAGIIRRAPALVAGAAICLLLCYTFLLWRFGGHGMPLILAPLGLFVYFAAGSYAYLARDRVPMRGWLAAVCVAVLVGTLPMRAFAFVAIPAICYLTLFAAVRLPLRGFDRRMDLSYGLYIYAFPVAQVLAMCGLAAHGLAAYAVLTFAIAAVFAGASWFVVEKPSLALKHRPFTLRAAGRSGAAL